MKSGHIALIHSNPIRIHDGFLHVDRKFHLGMLRYAEMMHLPCYSVHPELPPGQAVMDSVVLPIRNLPYRISSVSMDGRGSIAAAGIDTVRDAIRNARVVYGTGMSSYSISRELRRIYVSIQEYDLQTQLTVTTSEVGSLSRKLVRAVRCIRGYRAGFLPEIKGADAVHCNGFPVYDVVRRHNANSLLYLDSRMLTDMVIPRADLEARIGSLRGRRLRLLYSGRYEPLKGADHAVKVGVECLRRGLDIELHCYGQGSLKHEMQRIAGSSVNPDRIHIHDAVPYPDLVNLSRTFDLFVCCHVQNDPSCTYLESMGAGLPIVGYANRMWRRLSTVSGAGYCSPLGRPAKVADDIQSLSRNLEELAKISCRAAEFAGNHCFEEEFRKRIESINSMI